MWDAWAAYSPLAIGYLVREKQAAVNVEAARAEAISYAAYRLLKYRFPAGYVDIDGKPCHPNAGITQLALDAQMTALGYDAAFTSTFGPSPAALGNRIAAAVIAYGQSDGSNEGEGRCYPDNSGYSPVNPPMIFGFPGVGDLIDPNRWQPLAFDYYVTQNGIIIGQMIQRFIGVGWGDVTPFALRPSDAEPGTGLYLNPGYPPQLGSFGDETVKTAIAEVIRYSSQVDPADGVLVDISPAAIGNNSLGADDGAGRALNPVTALPYPPNVVPRADFTRVVAEFWADGPHSETPPGHWNVIANYVADHPRMRGNKRIGGRGPVVRDLEWDVKVYLALNGAVHDAAIWCWGTKNYYDASRPITLVRYMASLGQSSDPAAPSYHLDGLPLVPGLIELITPETTQPGGRHEHLAGYEEDIAIRVWKGSPENPRSTIGGVVWRRALEWMPYQASTFVTPPFPGYPSGHSTYSRAAAEVLAEVTGWPYFPGGVGTFVARRNQYLSFELGPTQDVTLQWATYFDAADQAAISRRFGGIHPYYDDYPSRITGSLVGKKAWAKALTYYGPRSVAPVRFPVIRGELTVARCRSGRLLGAESGSETPGISATRPHGRHDAELVPLPLLRTRRGLRGREPREPGRKRPRNAADQPAAALHTDPARPDRLREGPLRGSGPRSIALGSRSRTNALERRRTRTTAQCRSQIASLIRQMPP